MALLQYTYGCLRCGHRQTVSHAADNSPWVSCEACQGLCEQKFESPPMILRSGAPATSPKHTVDEPSEHTCIAGMCALHHPGYS